MAGVPRSEPVAVRLDEALADMRAAAATPETARRASVLAEAWLGLDPVEAAPARPPPAGGRSTKALDALLLDAAMPRLLDQSSLQPERLLSLLEEVAGLVVPDGAQGGPLAEVGAAMIEEELAKYRLLLGLKNALIEA